MTESKTPAKKTVKKPAVKKTSTAKRTSTKKPTSRKPKTTQEEIKVAGTKLKETVKKILHEGNVRRVIIKNKDKVLLELPVNYFAVGIIAAPYLFLLGVVAAFTSEYSIVIERTEEK